MTEEIRAKTAYSAPALEKGFNVIELLATEQRGMTASEIAAGLGLSVSEIFRIIIVMERRGWLRKSSGDRYRVTPMVLALAFRATPAEELSALAMPYMRELCAATDQSCHLVIRNADKGLIIARLQNPGPTGFHVRIGSEIDLETSCSGHVLLAFASSLRGQTSGENADERFAALMHAIRQRGYERMESARTLGVTDISYPIFDIHGDVAAALTVPFLRRIDGTQSVSLDDTQDFLGQTAKRISEDLAAASPTATGSR
jgi:DNA-binding IclR family transcriptional regulator